MARRRLAACTCVVMFGCVVLAGSANAQQASAIAGTVRDSSGAVLPGVTVEASSPALIERVRVAVTDSEGRYNIVELRPGTYAVTFSLAGFSAARREDIRLTAGFTATVNAELQVGALTETVIVTGDSPLVDLESAGEQTIVSNDLIQTLPSGGKGLLAVARLIPGMSGGTDSGGAQGIYAANFVTSSTLHGKNNGKAAYDGMHTANLAGVGLNSYVPNPATVEEMVVESAGFSAESIASGFSFNLVPREGSNEFHLYADGVFTNDHFQSNNLNDDLRSRGLTTTKHVLHLYDASVALGGSVKKDKVWFFAATRFSGTKTDVPGVYFNLTQGTPFYTPDFTRPRYSKEWLKSQAGRITWQASPKNKVSVFADVQSYQVRGQSLNWAPESHLAWAFWPGGLYQATWSSPVSNRVLLEAGFGFTPAGFTYTREQATDLFGFTVKPTDISIFEASSGFIYNAKTNYYDKNQQDRYMERFSVSYVTGSHAFKMGFQLEQHIFDQNYIVNQGQQWTFLNGRPLSITQWAQPLVYKSRTKADLGLYAQDRWNIKRLTINYGLRFDYFNAYVPATKLPAGDFVGARDFAPVYGVPEWWDLNPRLGVAYDLFGNGRTALKGTVGRYVGKMATALALNNSPVITSINSVRRSWTDDGNFIPDCDLRNFEANGECGKISNANFGQSNASAITYDDDLLRGFGNRDYLWDYSAVVEHQLTRRVALSAGYYGNWSPLFTDSVLGSTTWVNDNLAQTPADYEPFCVTAPLDSRLPGGGGYEVCGLYDLVPSKFGQGEIVARRPDYFGKGKRKHSDFFTVSFNTRFGEGIDFGGSLDTGRTVVDQCFAVDNPGVEVIPGFYEVVFNPNTETTINGERVCRTVTPFAGQTQVKVYGSVPIKGGFIVSGVFQNTSGVSYQANWRVPNSVIAPSLKRNLAACGTAAVCNQSVLVPLLPPNTYFEPRRNLVDLRLSKVFPLSEGRRFRVNLDIFNVFNDSSVLAINHNYGTAWLQPVAANGTSLTVGRLVELGGELSF